MQVRTTLNEGRIKAIAAGLYDGNLTVEVEHKSTTRKGVSTYRVKVGASDSRGAGARRSWSGRRGPWACWHAFRDFFYGIYAEDADAIIVTGLARYNGLEGFEREYPGTAYKNVGSMVQPAYMDELCDC